MGVGQKQFFSFLFLNFRPFALLLLSLLLKIGPQINEQATLLSRRCHFRDQETLSVAWILSF